MNIQEHNQLSSEVRESASMREIVFVIDDDISVREGLAELIGSLGFHVQAYPCAEEFLRNKPLNTFGCIILDVFMPGISGLDLQQELNAANVYLPVIFLTGRGDIPMTVHALKAGAAHFLTKPVQERELIQALREALAAGRRTRRQNAELDEIRRRISTLAPREREVMALVVSGLLNKQIAHEMGISERTVKLYRACVMRKMAAESVAALARQAEMLHLAEFSKARNISNRDPSLSARL